MRALSVGGAIAMPHLARDPAYGGYWRTCYASMVLALAIVALLVEGFVPSAFRLAPPLLLLLVMFAAVESPLAIIIFPFAAPLITIVALALSYALPTYLAIPVAVVLAVVVCRVYVPRTLVSGVGTTTAILVISPLASLVVLLSLASLGTGSYLLEGFLPPTWVLACLLGVAVLAPVAAYALVDEVRGYQLRAYSEVPWHMLSVALSALSSTLFSLRRASWYLNKAKKVETFRGALQPHAVKDIARELETMGLELAVMHTVTGQAFIDARREGDRAMALLTVGDVDTAWTTNAAWGNASMVRDITHAVRDSAGRPHFLVGYTSQGRNLEKLLSDVWHATDETTSGQTVPVLPQITWNHLPGPDSRATCDKLERLAVHLETARRRIKLAEDAAAAAANVAKQNAQGGIPIDLGRPVDEPNLATGMAQRATS